ncbi:MAG: hypothetical protein AAF802_09370 [Planctomycetota bacterium]
MTQMMLFDSNATTTVAPVLPTPTPQATASSVASSQSGSRQPGEDGIHQMGDLARLVLLRYQLMAKRREEIAARKRAR